MTIAYIDCTKGVTPGLILEALRTVGARKGTDVSATLHALGVTKIHASAIPVGPATPSNVLKLLKGWPVISGKHEVTAEGVALVTTLADPSPFPGGRLDRIGTAGGLRVLLIEASTSSNVVVQIETNLDNASGETIGHLFDRLFAAGALDVFTTPIQMKKSRPGVLLSVLAPPAKSDALEKILLTESPTFGVRRSIRERRVLDRDFKTVKTKYGPIRCKIGRLDGKIVQFAPEFEDVKRAAEKHGVPLATVRRAAEQD